MSAHLQQDDLDLLVALVADGDADETMLAHVADCDACRERFDEAVVEVAEFQVHTAHRIGIEAAALRLLDEVDSIADAPQDRYGRGETREPRVEERERRPRFVSRPRFWRFMAVALTTVTGAALVISSWPRGAAVVEHAALQPNDGTEETHIASAPATSQPTVTFAGHTTTPEVAFELALAEGDAEAIFLRSLSYALWRRGTHPEKLNLPALRLEKGEFKDLLAGIFDMLDPRDRVVLGQALLKMTLHEPIRVDGLIGHETRSATRAFQSEAECDARLAATGTLDCNTLLCLVDSTVGSTVVIRRH